MERLSREIMEELNCETAFSVKIAGYDIEISEAVVISWIVIAAVFIICIVLTHNLQVRNASKRQLLAETIVIKLEALIGGMIGEEAKEYIPYMATVLFFIGFSNIIGIFGFKPPTKDMNVTLALAIMSIILVQAAGIRKKRGLGWLKSFTEPIAIVMPINILELVIKPLSLCMRLFGNVVGAFIIMELLKSLVPVFVPVIFSAYFDIFDGLLQAYIFVFLTSMYIREAVE
ncbi:MAG: F0F1 ATP synthase subunit A [Lachnospiraceae bacterium]|nr:F0F1 ATP synthase subunit A [Lachnospiraceae bacterium]